MMQKKVRDDLTEEEKRKLLAILASQKITDSDVEDFCDEHAVSRRTVHHQLAVWRSPKECQGCKHVDMYPNMPPCASCRRSHNRDCFAPEKVQD